MVQKKTRRISLAYWFLLFVIGLGHAHLAQRVMAQGPIEPDECSRGWIRPLPSVDGRPVQPSSFYLYGSTGQGLYQVHHGLDFVRPMGTPVVAVVSGQVVVAGDDQSHIWGKTLDYYGQLVVILSDDLCNGKKVYVLYGHLEQVAVRVGERVKPGQVIGTVGMRGIAIGPHLHFEVRVGENSFAHTQNPLLWLAPLPGYGRLIGRLQDTTYRPLEGVLLDVRHAETPGHYWREAWTYSEVDAESLHLDARWQENWALIDVPPGTYLLWLKVQGRVEARRVHVYPNQTSFVLWTVGEPLNLPKPGPDGIILAP